LSVFRIANGSTQLFVGPAASFERADKRAVLDARDVTRIGAREIAAGPLLGIELGERAGADELRTEGGVFLGRAVDPVDVRRLAKGGHFLDPLEQMLVLGEGLGGIALRFGHDARMPARGRE
jgi:hypothetical protein